MLKWLASLVFSSLTFAIADVLCDICIAERDEELKTVESAADDEDTELEEVDCSQAGASDAKQDRYARDSDGLQLLGVTLSRPNAGPRYKQVAGNGAGRAMGSWSSAQPAAQEELVALTGEQDAAIAGAHSPGMRSRLLHVALLSAVVPTPPSAALPRQASSPSSCCSSRSCTRSARPGRASDRTRCSTCGGAPRRTCSFGLRCSAAPAPSCTTSSCSRPSRARPPPCFSLLSRREAPAPARLHACTPARLRACPPAPAHLRACPPGLRLPAWPPARRRPPACCQPHLCGAAAAVWRGRWRRSPCSWAPRWSPSPATSLGSHPCRASHMCSCSSEVSLGQPATRDTRGARDARATAPLPCQPRQPRLPRLPRRAHAPRGYCV